MKSEPSHHLDQKVSPKWKPVEALDRRASRMGWSDRVFYWLSALAALATIGVGVLVLAYLHWPKLGGILMGVGLVGFALSSPSQSARNGYRSN